MKPIYCLKKSEEWFATVRDEEGKLLGSISRARVLEQIQHQHGENSVLNILPEQIGRIQSNATLSDARRMMNELGQNYLLVLNDHAEAVGVIGSSDIIQCYKE